VNAHWGPNNRSVALRIPHSDAKGRRIEHRASCADASPHLAMAAVLAGLHHGIRNKLQPSQPIELSRADTIAPPRGFKTPASHLHAALDDLVKAKRITDTIPTRFLKAYRDTKRGEFNELFERPTPREYDFYL
jgi:glutamine synthetase